MTEVTITDAGGDILALVDVEGHLYPRFPLEALQGLSDFPVREDDVFVCAYPKSGTHWVWEMIRMLRAASVDIPVLEKDEGMIEFFPPEKFAALPSPRTLNTHVLFSRLPRQVWEKKPKIVLVIRNPKDVFVSYYNHHRQLIHYYEYQGAWRNYFPLVLSGKGGDYIAVDYGSWFDYTAEWEAGMEEASTPPVHVVYYEDIKKDPILETRKICTFLGLDFDDDFLSAVCATCGFDNMKKRKGHMELGADGKPVMYRKGQVGDWKNWFTVAQNEAFDRVYREKMAGSSFSVRFT